MEVNGNDTATAAPVATVDMTMTDTAMPIATTPHLVDAQQLLQNLQSGKHAFAPGTFILDRELYDDIVAVCVRSSTKMLDRAVPSMEAANGRPWGKKMQ